MSPELVALNAQLGKYIEDHNERSSWPASLRAFDVTGHCAELALEFAPALQRSAMMDARLAIAVSIDGSGMWIDSSASQLLDYLESL